MRILRSKSLGEMHMESGRTHSKAHEKKRGYQGAANRPSLIDRLGPAELVHPDGSSTYWPSYVAALAAARRGDVVCELLPGDDLQPTTTAEA